MVLPTTLQEIKQQEYVLDVLPKGDIDMSAWGWFKDVFGIEKERVKIHLLFVQDGIQVYRAYIDPIQTSADYCYLRRPLK